MGFVDEVKAKKRKLSQTVKPAKIPTYQDTFFVSSLQRDVEQIQVFFGEYETEFLGFVLPRGRSTFYRENLFDFEYSCVGDIELYFRVGSMVIMIEQTYNHWLDHVDNPNRDEWNVSYRFYVFVAIPKSSSNSTGLRKRKILHVSSSPPKVQYASYTGLQLPENYKQCFPFAYLSTNDSDFLKLLRENVVDAIATVALRYPEILRAPHTKKVIAALPNRGRFQPASILNSSS